MSVNGVGGGNPVAGAIASIQKACLRLNPCMELDVDVLAVTRAAMNSTAADWNAGTKTNVTVDPSSGLVKLTPGSAAAIFTNTATGLPTAKHQFIDGSVSSRGAEEYAIDFFPDPNVTGGVPFTLSKLDVFLGRYIGSGIPSLDGNGKFRVSVSYYDTNWRVVPLGDPIDIAASAISLSGAAYTIDFRALNRLFVFDSGNQNTRTGTGFDGTSNRAAVNPDIKGANHLTLARGLSISITPSGRGFTGCYIGCYPNGGGAGQAAQFDTTTFWRHTSSDDRNCGPYNPDLQPYPANDTSHNPDNFLLTGAVPGYGARSVTNGMWGIARRVLTAQHGQDNGQAWLQPYHSLWVETYASSGSIVSTLDMGGVPTNPVEIRIDDWQPRGTSMAYTLRRSPDNATWTSIGTVTDGQILTGSNLARYYELTATFTPGPSGGTKYASPALQSWAMIERVSLSTYRLLRDVDSTVTADPVTAQSSIGELTLPILKAGRADFRDLGTQISSSYAPSQLEAHVYARNTITGTRLFLNSYRLENRNPLDGNEEMTFVSGMDRLSVKIPAPSETYRYPTSGQGTITTSTRTGVTTTYVITPSGTPGFTASALIGMRYRGITGASAGFDFVITANTTSTFSVTVPDAPTNAPAASDTFEIHSDVTQRTGAAYVGQDFAAVYSDLLSVQAAVPARYRGKLPATTGRTTTYSLPADGVKALDVLQDVALHCGGFPSWNKGRIDFVDLYGKKDSVATWDDRHIVSLTTPLGADRRMPSLRLKYNWAADTKTFTNQVTYEDYDALLGWGRPNLFDVFEPPDEFCKWNDQAEATYIATMFQNAWKTGVRIWSVKTALMWPWLEQGDAVTILTNQYSDRRLAFSGDGLTDNGTGVYGPVSAIGVIVGKNLWGTEFLVAVRGLDQITGSTTTTGPSGPPPTVPPVTPPQTGPGGVAGCILWCRANDLLFSLKDGDNVNSWFDQSGNANHGSSAVATTKPTFATNVFPVTVDPNVFQPPGVVSGLPGIHFDNHAFIDFVYSKFSSLTAGEIFVVMKRDVSPPPNTGARGFWYFSSDSLNPAQVPTPSASVTWDNFGTTTTKVGSAWTPGTNPAIYNVSSGSSAWTQRVDGAEIYTTTTNTVSFANGTNIACLGADYSGRPSPGYYFVGYFAEIIVFARVLSTNDRNAVKVYLSQKYEITVV